MRQELGRGRVRRTQKRKSSGRSTLWPFYVAIAALGLTNVATGLTLYVSPDFATLISNRDQAEVSAYQDRIAMLRLEVDRLHSRQYARAGDINLQLQDLLEQQDQLAQQHDYVRALAGKAQMLGLVPVTPPSPPERLRTGSLALAGTPGVDPLSRVADELAAMQSDSLSALTALSDAAEKSTNAILKDLKRLGLAPTLDQETPAIGGPLMPADTLSFADDQLEAVSSAATAIARFEQVRAAASVAPIHSPFVGQIRVSSNFGNRRDPFLKRTAFHSGMDFRAPSGTEVHPTGPGKIVFAGRKGGYGNMIEIVHPQGLVTRYAHLSRILVSVGDTVTLDDVIGRVGSTGRSTGPHLHLEVRINDKPVDPSIYIAAGKRISQYL